jgi:DNA polymerase I-like protein with 3'-5' exonuclease and polymerase domains
VEWNPNSSKHVAQVFETLGIKPVKVNRETGVPVWDKKVLSGLLVHDSNTVREVANAILSFKAVAKMHGTYIAKTKMGEDGRIHPTWKAMHAASLRWGCEKDNESNIPKALRVSRVARPGHVLIRADWRAQELRIVAQVAKCSALLDAFLRGADVHSENTAAVMKVSLDKVDELNRHCFKMIQFSMNYGATFDTVYALFMLQPKLRSMPKRYVQKMYDAMLDRLFEIPLWWEQVRIEAKRTGKVLIPGSPYWVPSWGHFDLNFHTNVKIQGRGAWMQYESLMHQARIMGIDVEKNANRTVY